VSERLIKVHEKMLDALMKKDNEEATALLEQRILVVEEQFQKITDYLGEKDDSSSGLL